MELKNDIWIALTVSLLRVLKFALKIILDLLQIYSVSIYNFNKTDIRNNLNITKIHNDTYML